MRVAMLRRLARWRARGKRCILLYCGDHDVHGLRISTALRSNLEGVLLAFRRAYPEWEDFDLDAVRIERFGLNADFIKVNRLSWTNNLITGGGKDLADPEHTLHWNRDVQDYIKRFGERKVEGDALMTRPQAGRELCEAAILSYLDEDASRGSIGQLGASASRCVRPSTGYLASKGTPNEHRAHCR